MHRLFDFLRCLLSVLGHLSFLLQFALGVGVAVGSGSVTGVGVGVGDGVGVGLGGVSGSGVGVGEGHAAKPFSECCPAIAIAGKIETNPVDTLNRAVSSTIPSTDFIMPPATDQAAFRTGA